MNITQRGDPMAPTGLPPLFVAIGGMVALAVTILAPNAEAIMRPGAIGNDGSGGFDGSITSKAGHEFDTRVSENAINGNGLLANGDHDVEHLSAWMGDLNSNNPLWFIVDLGQSYPLNQLHFYNYSNNVNVNRGVRTASIYIYDGATEPNANNNDVNGLPFDNSGWTLMYGDQTFIEATAGTDPFGVHNIIPFGGIDARFVAFAITANHSGGASAFAGISELQFFPGAVPDPPTFLHVATNGNDAWSGDLDEPMGGDGPLASLQGARDRIREMKTAGTLPAGGIEVRVQGGTYSQAATLDLTSEDSGTAITPLVYSAVTGQQVRLTGGTPVTNFTAVTDPAILGRLDPSAFGQVVEADLNAMGIDLGGEVGAAENRLELFFEDLPMTPARWPNEGFTTMVEVLGDGSEGRFVYGGDRPERWVDESDLWLQGYWFFDWWDDRMKVASIDTGTKVIELTPPEHRYGYRAGQWYYAFNALSEIDLPGEWCLDRQAGMLYFYPPGPLVEGSAVVSVTGTLLNMQSVSHVTLRGFTLEAARGHGALIESGTSNRFIGCTFRNLGRYAVNVFGGSGNGVVGCDITETGEGGILLSGGDRTSLSPAGHHAVNNHIHHYARWIRVLKPAIQLWGVGNRAANNLIHNAPHMAMGLSGNDHVIESNEIHSVVYETNDAGAIYMGRDWTMRGNVIRHNYLHDVSGLGGLFAAGIYLDDMFSSADISSNVFYNVLNAAFIGGGRDNSVINNIFVDCNPALRADGRALDPVWAGYHADAWLAEQAASGTISGIAFDQPPYSVRFPELAQILQGNPKAPEGNVVARNISTGGVWSVVHSTGQPYFLIESNLVDVDPHFVDAENLDFQLLDGSPAFALGFERIPIGSIGLTNDGTRASWPVFHSVRPIEPRPRPAVNVVTIDLVAVGNPGNAADTTGLPIPCGAVADKYRIGAHEVTAGQYTEFLNAVAATDPHALYSIFMFVDAAGCKIQQSGGSGYYTYSVPSDYADRPVNNVSWGDAARFANWLHNGQPTGAQDASTTEDGSYTLNGAITDVDLASVTRNAGATWWIPSENEWYKAAYHKNDGVTGNYWDYPTGTDSDPGRDLTEITNPGNNANYHAASPYPIDGAYYATEKGEFELSDSPYGTFDQGGNVWEWTEASNPSVRIRRGSGFGSSTISDMSVIKRVESPPLLQQNDMGFRVATRPFPGTRILLR
jgi:formylglycine-generating enzyme required for sulfatase activity